MTLKAPNSEQKESMDLLFRARTQHKDNFLSWLDECREAAVQRVLYCGVQEAQRAIGELATLESLITILKKF